MIASVVVSVLVLAVPAASKKPGIVPLVKVSAGVSPSWVDPLLKAAQSADLKAMGTWVAPPAVSLEEAQAALGCSAWNDSCAGQVAGMTGAATAFLVDVRGTEDGGADIVAKYVGANGSAKSTPSPRRLHLPGRTGAELDLAKVVVKAAAQDDDVAFLVIESDTPGAEVTVDGKAEGKTPWPRPLAMPAGAHAVMLSQEGRAPLSFSVHLPPYTITRETKTLGAAGPDKAPEPVVGVAEPITPPPEPEQPPPETSKPPPTMMIVGWGVVGAGALVTLVGLWFTTAWTTGYFEAADTAEKGDSLRRCVGWCTTEGVGPGIFGATRNAYLDGTYPAFLGASIAAVVVGGGLIGGGTYLALTAEE